MLTLETTRTLRAVAGTAAAIDYVISCDEVSAGGDSFKVGADGQLPNTITTLYTVPGSGVVSALVNAIDLSNTTGSAVPVTLYVGNPTNRQIFKTTIPANGTVSMTRDGWKVYDSTGLLVLTVPLGSATPQTLSAGAGSAGTSTTAARDDHQHQHGDLSASSATMHSKASVGLANVDNTSDVNKPVSTAQAAADTAATAAAQATSLQKASNLSDLANAGTARTNLGLGTAATQPTSAFDAAGAAAAAQAASQPLDSDLTDIAAETATTDNVLQSVASHWKSRTPAQLKATLALVKGDVGLGNVDNTSDVNKPVSTAQAAADSAVLALSLQKASNLSDLANAGTARTNLGLGSAATQPSTAFDAAGAAAAAQAASQPLDATLTALAGQNWATDAIPVGTGADTVTQLALAAGTIPGKSSAGAVAAKVVSDAGFAFLAAANVAAETALLNPATTLLKGLMSATDKLKSDDSCYDLVAQGGADPTGVTDCTTIFNAAVTTVATLGGILFIPAGTFKVNTAGTALTLNGNYVTVRGAGSVATAITSNHATSDVFAMSANNCVIENLRIIATASTTKTAGYGVNITGANCNVRNCDIIYMWAGVKMTGQLARCDFLNIRECGRNAINGNGILVDAFVDQYITNVVMDNGNGVGGVPNSAGHAGIRVTNLSSLILQNLQIIHSTNCLDVTTSANTIPSIKATGCFFDTSAIGLNMVQTSTGVISRCEFLNCWFGSHTTAGVVLNGANVDGIEFSGCEFYGSPFGIQAVLYKDWAVRSSRFAGNTSNAIITTAVAAGGFTISDCFIGSQAGFGANAQGINIQAGTYARYQVSDCRGFDTNTAPGMIDLGTTALAWSKTVNNNIGMLNTGAAGTLAAALPANFTASADNVMSGTLFPLPTKGLRVGSKIKYTFTVTKTLAGVAVWSAKAKFGTAGTNADAAIATFTSGTNTALVDVGTYVIIVEVLSLGAAATCKANLHGVNAYGAAATGLGQMPLVPTSTATFNSDAAIPFMHLDITPGAAAVMNGVGAVEVIA